MTAKRAHQKPSKLKRSFVVTFSAVAALSGCGDDMATNPPPTDGTGGFAGSSGGTSGEGGTSGVGGAAGTAGHGGSAGTVAPNPECPSASPIDDTACEVSPLTRCEYVLSTDICDPNGHRSRANCDDGVWDVRISITACNPPPPDPDHDGGADDDAGLVDEDAGL